MMIALKAISFSPTKLCFPCTKTLSKKNSILFLCKSEDAGSDGPDPKGDARTQELLASIAMLQAQKVRVADYLDERSAHLTQFAEEANAEFDEIEENAQKGLDEAGARIMENIETRMQAFEESAALNKIEIDKNEKNLEEFEGQIVRDRNEGMFFKNLGQRPPQEKAKAKEEVKKIKQLMKRSAGSKTRRNIYLALMGLLAIGIADAFISSSDWRKVAGLGLIWIALLTQFIYEQRMSLETERTEKTGIDKEEK
ncbi:uncharacterized protein LOC131168571 [Malania oleifera]|uniref:uncharacterized protein LOC131168571 n=1 Tax=Malania oleifera TaxID=397392 RepID=UPI0025AE8967|nr:uncharacterized protein LOC131168571 [Malania oleifera]